MTAVGVLIGIYAPHHILPDLLVQGGTDVWQTIVLFTVLAAPVAAFVYAVAVYSLVAWRPRATTPDEPPPDGAPLRGNGPMTILWLGLHRYSWSCCWYGGWPSTAPSSHPPADPPGQRDRPTVAVDL